MDNINHNLHILTVHTPVLPRPGSVVVRDQKVTKGFRGPKFELTFLIISCEMTLNGYMAEKRRKWCVFGANCVLVRALLPRYPYA